MFPLRFVTIVTVLLCLSANNARSQHSRQQDIEAESNPEYWLNKAASSLDDHLLREPIKAKAKNVIFFLGDGMSLSTITATRIFEGQKAGYRGEEGSLSFESFPWTGLSKTYCVNSQVADSACSATAFLTGVKANKGTLGVSAAVKLDDCKSMRNTSNHAESVLSWAQRACKSTGVVTTTRITHATPAGSYAHTASRHWEDDSRVLRDKRDPTFCEDIASQLIHRSPGRNINVILGGGRRGFRPESMADETKVKGRRQDGKDLIKAWIKDKKRQNLTHSYVWNRNDLLNVDTKQTDYLLGLFSPDHMSYALDDAENQTPTLLEMTKVAIDVLSKSPQGYFLFVEGGRIDHAHHDNEARRALAETMEFSNAVKQAVEMTSPQDTLIVVTADHAHTMTISGYPTRGNDILGIAGRSDVDKLPYTTLGYANGPSYRTEKNNRRHDVSKDRLNRKDYKYPSMLPARSETHGGEDVTVYAAGCFAHLFSGVMEQNVIPLLIGYASCIGPHRTHCSDNPA